MRKLLKRAGLVAGAAAGLLLLLIVVGFVAWHGPRAERFGEVAGRYGGFTVLEERSLPGSHVRLIELSNDRGESVGKAWVRTPLERADPARALVVYAGQKTGADILELIPERPDLVLVGMQYPYTRPDGLVEYLRWPADVRATAFRSVAAGMLAVGWLEREESIDPARIGVLGASLGSSLATIHGAVDPRVSDTVLIHGGGDLSAVVYHSVRRRWLAWPATQFAEIVVDTFDPLHYAGDIAPRRFLLIADRSDEFFPPDSAQQLYDAAREPKRIIWSDTGHVRSRRHELIERMVRQVEWYLDGVDAPGPPPP